MTAATVGLTLDKLSGQVAALCAIKGTKIPPLNAGDEPLEMRSVLHKVRIALHEEFQGLRGDPPALARYLPEFTRILAAIEALEAQRYPAAVDTSDEAVDAIAARLTAPIVPRKGADGR